MQKDAQKTDWKEVEDACVSQWYHVSKIMGRILPSTFPYFTFDGLVEEIRKDPNFKSKDDEDR